MTRRKFKVATIRDDGSTELLDDDVYLRQRKERADKTPPAKEPETLHEAMRDLSLSSTMGHRTVRQGSEAK